MSIPKTPYSLGLTGEFNATGITLVDAESRPMGAENEPLSEADGDQRALNLQNLIQRANAGDEDAARLVSNRAHAGSALLESDRKEQERFWREYAQIQLQELRDRLEAINRELAELEDKITAFEKRLDEIKDANDAIDRVIAQAEEKGEFELDQDGKLADRMAEGELQAYEKRTGRRVDRADYLAVLMALRIQKQENDREKVDIGVKRREAKERRAEVIEERKAVNDALDETDPRKQVERIKALGVTDQSRAITTVYDDSSREEQLASKSGIDKDEIEDEMAGWAGSEATSKPDFNRTASLQHAKPEAQEIAQAVDVTLVNKPSGLS